MCNVYIKVRFLLALPNADRFSIEPNRNSLIMRVLLVFASVLALGAGKAVDPDVELRKNLSIVQV